MPPDDYNKDLCDERHETIKERLGTVEDKLDKLAPQIFRIVGFLTALGVGGSAAVQLIGG